MKKIKLLGVLMGLLLMGQFAFAQAGSTFSNPQVVSTLPFVAVGDSTCGYGDNYSTADIACTGSYLNGDEKIYSFTPSSNIASFNVELTNLASTWSGMFITDDTTTSGNCLGSVGSSGSSDRGIYGVSLTAGTTYYILVSTYPSPQCITSYDINMYTISCPAPTALTATSITTTTANLAWTESGSATLWQYEYDTTGFTQGTGTIDTTSSNPKGISGLTAATSYEFYVRAICGAGDTSTWSGPYSFYSACNAFSVPFQEGFNSASTSLNCWTIVDNNNDGDTWSINTSSSYVYEGDQSAQVYTDGNGGNNDDYFISPAITLTGNDRIRYWYRARSASEPNDYKILVSTTNSNLSSFTDTIYTDTATSTTYAESIVDISSYSGTVYFAFYIPNGGLDGWRLYIDDFNVEVIPSCVAPNNLNVTNILANSASFSWTETGSATLWQYEYDTAGFTPGTGTIDTTSMNPVLITGLTAETDYEFYVRAVCGAGDSSVWIGPYSFTTLCAAVTAPWNEDFSSSSLPNCWNQGVNNLESWLFGSSGGHVGNAGTIGGTTASGGNFAWVDDSSPHNSNTALESPLVDVSGLTDPELSFYLISNNEGNTNVDFSVDVWDGAAWNVGFYSRNTNTLNGEWEQINLSLSSLTITGPVRLRFIVDETNGTDYYDDVAIDDVRLRETPTCVDVSALVATGVTNTTAMFGWTENGTATLWQYEYDTLGFAQGSGTIDTTSSNPYTASGLTPNTDYEFYIRAVCGAGDTSGWVGPMSFKTLCNPVVSFPYLEGFEDTSSTRGCWSNIQEVGSSDWTYGSGASGGSISSAYEGSENARFVSTSGTNSPITKLVSPTLDLTGLTAPVVSFFYGQEDWSGDQNYTRVLYRTSATGAWTQIWADSSDIDTWTKATVVLPNTSATYQIAFEGINNYGRRNVVDNVFVGDTLAATAVVDSNATCFGMADGGATITANGGLMPYTYLWSNADTTASITGVPAGTYDVTVSDAAGDSIMASVTITEPGQVVVSLGNDTSICVNDLLTLDAGAGFSTYLWDNGVTTQTRVVNSSMAASNAYSVIVTDANGCNGYDTVNVDVNAPMMPNLGNDTTICYDATLVLDAGAGFNSYLWDDASTLQTRDVVGATVGSAVHTMYVATTDANMCTGMDTIIVTVDAEITVDLGNDTTVCSGTTFDLDAGAGYASYLWDDLSTMQTRTVATNAAGATNYSVIVTTTAGCIGTSTIEVTGRAPVVVDLGPDTAISWWGADTTYTLDAGSGFASYLWSDNVTTTQTFVVNKDNMGLIGVVVTDANGCIGTDTVRVDFLLSVPSFDVSTLKMYPNPASDQISLEMSNFNNVDEVNVRFISITGEVVLRRQINVNGGSYQETFDVSNLATGTYFVQFEAKGEVVTRKFVIK